MNFLQIIKTKNKKLEKVTLIGIKCCLLLALIATLILSFYKSSYILFQYYLGFTLLKTSISFFVSFIICHIAFIRITNETE